MDADILKRYFANTYSQKDFFAVDKAVRQGEERLWMMDHWMEFDETSLPEIQLGHILDKVQHRIYLEKNEKRKPVRFLMLVQRVAVVLLLPALFLLIYTNRPAKNQFANNTDDLEVLAPEGARMHLQLGDGTTVWLNNGSKLRYPHRFTGNSRKVYLSGEGYFEVAHNKDVPFWVSTDHLTVKATGTIFNVNAYPDDDLVETTLIEGKVILFDASAKQEIKPMLPDECVSFEYMTNRYTVKTANIQKNIAWKDGLLVFKRDSINIVTKKLERRYNIDIEITNQNVKRFTYTATFADEPLPQVLELLSLATPLSYKIIPREELADGTYTRQKVLIGLKTN